MQRREGCDLKPVFSFNILDIMSNDLNLKSKAVKCTAEMAIFLLFIF